MYRLKKIAKAFSFIASGIVAIAVGFFMLAGVLRLWDRKDAKNSKSENDSL